jgi:alkaline phosphatase
MAVRPKIDWRAAAIGAALMGAIWYFWEANWGFRPPVETSREPLRIADAPRQPRFEQPAAAEAPRSMILIVGDGLGFSELEASRLLLRGIGGQLTLDRLPITGWQTTRSADDVVTDSAAAATALATGHKTDNGAVGIGADGKRLKSLFDAGRDRGKGLGVITDSYLWDATPSAFYAHRAKRKEYAAIAGDLASKGLDVAIGTERHGFEDDDDDDGPVLSVFTRQGFALAHDWAGIEGSDRGRKLVGVFPSNAITPIEGASLLPKLVEHALARLAANPEGFLLVIETEETDTGSHENILDQTRRGVAALDATVAVAADFVARDGRTLMLVTADHETGGLSFLKGKAGKSLEFTWATGSHTGEPVPVFAYGPGAERFTGVHDNTDLPRLLAGLLGLDLD